MKKRKPSQTRRHRESVRAKRKARAFYFERQAAKDAEESKDSLQHESDRWWKALVDVCGRVFAGLAAAWLVYGIIQLIRNS